MRSYRGGGGTGAGGAAAATAAAAAACEKLDKSNTEVSILRIPQTLSARHINLNLYAANYSSMLLTKTLYR